jgi:PTS system galactitol-specific IIA component
MELKSYYVKGTREEALSFLSDELRAGGYVKEGYKESLLAREEKYPTGLQLAHLVNIAIPHTEMALVEEETFVIGVPQNTMEFRRIDDPSQAQCVDLIFLFVIKNPQEYLQVLSRLTENFASEEFLGYIKRKDLEKVREFLREHVLQ